MRILVTGAAGFIGSQVTRRILQEGHKVFAVTRGRASVLSSATGPGDLRVLQADLCDPAAVCELVAEARPDCAVHLAWYAVPGKYWTAPENLDCVSMTLRLAQALARAGCPRLVVAGSCAEYDWNHGFLSEDLTPLRPRTLYGACKNAARQALQAYCERVSMELAWTRLFYLYGPGEAKGRLVPSVILSLLNGQQAKCTAGEQVRDLLHVEDAAAALWAVAASRLTGSVNIGSGQPTKIRDVAEALGEILQARERVVLGALATDPSDPPRLVADVRKLKSNTSWEPSWSLEGGLRQAVGWWQQRSRAGGVGV